MSSIKYLRQKFLYYFSNHTSLLFLVIMNFFALTLLVFESPFLGVGWLLLLTLFFLIKREYKNIFISWGIFFSFWYLLFIICFSDYGSPIWIGGDYTRDILIYFSYKYSGSAWYIGLFESFCVQTVFYIHLLSVQLGYPIYIPSPLN